MELRDIMSMSSYEQLFNTITVIAKTYIKNGDTISYIENGTEKVLEDENEKKKILAIIDLYIMLDKLIKKGVSIEEIDRGLESKKYQKMILADISKISKEEKNDEELYVFARTLIARYDGEESKQQRAYHLLRERVYATEAVKTIRSIDYETKIQKNTDIIYILKQAQALNLNGEEKDFIKDLLYNPHFATKLNELKKQIEDQNGKIQWEYIDFIWEKAKQLADDPRVSATQAQRDNYLANEYLNEESRISLKDKSYIIKFNDRNLIGREIINGHNHIVFLERPQKGHVSLIRILLKRNGFFMQQREENGQFIIDMIPIDGPNKPKVDVEPKN